MRSNEVILKAINDGNVVEAKKYLEENIRENAAKKAGAKSKDVTIIKRVLKDAENWVKDERATKAQPFTCFGKDYYGFLDGHRILADTNDFGYEHADDPYQIQPWFQAVEDYKELREVRIDRTKLMEKIALSRANRYNKLPYVIDVDGKSIGVNPKFLIDMMDFVGVDYVYVRKDENFCREPIYAINEENGRLGMTLPVNLSEALKNTVDQAA